MISLFMHGGPSHVDLLDPKPELSAKSGTEYGGDVIYSFVNRANKKLFGSPGSSASTASAAPTSPSCCRTSPALWTTFASSARCTPGTTGTKFRSAISTAASRAITGRPTMGSWIVYGLGSESQSLPAYMVLSDPAGHPVDGTHNWSSGFMPPLYQGTVLRAQEPRILNLDAPPQLRGKLQEQNLSFLAELNKRHLAQHPGEADLESRIASYELAAAMQTAAKEALDVSQEPATSTSCTGSIRTPTREYGTRCLIARRLVERGVRFVQLFLGGQPWDKHTSIKTALPGICAPHRPAGGGAGHRPQAAGPARYDDRPLGRRDRPAAGLRRGPERHRRPRPQRPGLFHLAGRRRHQGRA